MPGQNIGLSMPHGWAGSFTRQPDLIVDSHPLGGSKCVGFGAPLAYGTGADAGKVVPFGTGHTADDFVGVAARELKSALTYLEQDVGEYIPGETVSVLKRGCVNVVCQVGVPALGGKVYVRVASNEGIPTGVVGGFEAQADGANTVELTNCRWRGGADADKVAELRILTMHNA